MNELFVLLQFVIMLQCEFVFNVSWEKSSKSTNWRPSRTFYYG